MVIVNVKIRDNIAIWRLIADLVVHPEYRQLGIYRKMWEYAAKKANEIGLNFSYWVSGNPIIISTSKDYPGFPYPILNLVRIKDIDKQLKAMPMNNAWLYKIGFYTSKLTNPFRNILKKHGADWQSLPVYEVNSFTDVLEEFWTKVSKHYNFIIARNREYLNWRYCDPRAGGFVIRQVEIEGQILGFSVLKINKLRKDYPVGFIVDVITSPNRLDVANRLIADAVDYFDNQNINIINCLVIKDHPIEMIYRRHGFLDSKMKFYLYFGSPDTEREKLEIELNKIKTDSKDRLYFSYGDIDSLPSRLPIRR